MQNNNTATCFQSYTFKYDFFPADISQDNGPYVVARAEGRILIRDIFGSTDNLLGPVLENIAIEVFTYNCSSTEFSIKTVTTQSLPIIPGVWKLRAATLSIKATLSPVRINDFTFIGNWDLGSLNAHFSFSDQFETHQLLVSSVVSRKGGTTLDIAGFIKQLTGNIVSLPDTPLTFSQIEVSGAIDSYTGGVATLTVSGRLGKDKVIKVVLQKRVQPNSKYAAAFATTFSSSNFANLVQDNTGVDISGIPFIGSLVVPEMVVTVSTANITLSRKIDSTSLLRFSGYRIEKGFSAFFILSSLNEVPVKMSYSSNVFTFGILDGKSISISTLLTHLGLSLDLPPGLDVVGNVEIVIFSGY